MAEKWYGRKMKIKNSDLPPHKPIFLPANKMPNTTGPTLIAFQAEQDSANPNQTNKHALIHRLRTIIIKFDVFRPRY